MLRLTRNGILQALLVLGILLAVSPPRVSLAEVGYAQAASKVATKYFAAGSGVADELGDSKSTQLAGGDDGGLVRVPSRIVWPHAKISVGPVAAWTPLRTTRRVCAFPPRAPPGV